VENEAGGHLNGEVEMGEDGKVGEMLLPLGDLGAKVVVTHPGEAWEPSGSQKPNCYLLPPGSPLNLTQQYWEVEELVFDQIEELWLVNKAIHCLFIRSQVLEGAKDSIPDRKESTIVLVQTVSVRPMVHLMVSGGVEYEAKRADVTNQLGVNPKLEEENKLGVDKEL